MDLIARPHEVVDRGNPIRHGRGAHIKHARNLIRQEGETNAGFALGVIGQKLPVAVPSALRRASGRDRNYSANYRPERGIRMPTRRILAGVTRRLLAGVKSGPLSTPPLTGNYA